MLNIIYWFLANYFVLVWLLIIYIKRSRIWETKHLSTDAYSSTDAIGGWTKNTPKPGIRRL